MSRCFDFRYPIWVCPNCESENRFANTFGELCRNCGEDHTLDWVNLIKNEDIKHDWIKD